MEISNQLLGTMAMPGSVTNWIEALMGGDHSAAQELWNRYFEKMVGLARKKLQGRPRHSADEEDVALSAFDSFCRGAKKGKFPLLHDRHDLWGLLIVITARKALDLVEHERRAKRGGGRVLTEAALADLAGASTFMPGLERVIGREPTPEFAAQVAEELARLLENLEDTELRSVAVWKMEGHDNNDIAAKLGCVTRTVERKLRLIRNIWARQGLGKC
jgi:DNA-directed RNA polymerase specialized sigma24 family protein